MVPEGIVVQWDLVNTNGFTSTYNLPNTQVESVGNLAIPIETHNEPDSIYKNKVWYGFK